MPTPRHGLARVLSKAGICSRSQGEKLVREGRVSVDGRIVRDPEYPTDTVRHRLAIDGVAIQAPERVYVAMNKPRGLIVSASDEKGRSTIYDSLAEAGLPWLGPVGRLDKASEGLLLLSNDPEWAAGITAPETHLEKTYHVQVAGLPTDADIEAMTSGVEEGGDLLKARHAIVLRTGEKNAWLEVVLDEGRNRHIRRLLSALGFDVLRLLRVAIGSLVLGDLPKGQWRRLGHEEVSALRR
ncbi:MAG TPA: pseudouridine synthase [Luteibacter sp.]|jgi:pseudouridine synthase|nr:pseudouridine synthase [Luteibacter sp.]